MIDNVKQGEEVVLTVEQWLNDENSDSYTLFGKGAKFTVLDSTSWAGEYILVLHRRKNVIGKLGSKCLIKFQKKQI